MTGISFLCSILYNVNCSIHIGFLKVEHEFQELIHALTWKHYNDNFMLALVPRGLEVQQKHGRPSQKAAERDNKQLRKGK